MRFLISLLLLITLNFISCQNEVNINFAGLFQGLELGGGGSGSGSGSGNGNGNGNGGNSTSCLNATEIIGEDGTSELTVVKFSHYLDLLNNLTWTDDGNGIPLSVADTDFAAISILLAEDAVFATSRGRNLWGNSDDESNYSSFEVYQTAFSTYYAALTADIDTQVLISSAWHALPDGGAELLQLWAVPRYLSTANASTAKLSTSFYRNAWNADGLVTYIGDFPDTYVESQIVGDLATATP